MSFSKEIKQELEKEYSRARHCQIAELAAILSVLGDALYSCEEGLTIKLRTENLTVAQKYFMLLEAAFHYHAAVKVSQVGKKGTMVYTVTILHSWIARQVLQATKFQLPEGAGLLGRADRLGSARQSDVSLVHEAVEPPVSEVFQTISHRVIMQTCCKRAFLRGVFLACGSINSPEKTYHFELVFNQEEKAQVVKEVMEEFELPARLVKRKKYYVIYMKDGSSIVEVLNIMGAHQGLMNLENIRIVKEMRNSINRQVNCETANIHKTVEASTKQLEDIQYIRDTIGFSGLKENLRQIASLRLEQPEASLKELGQLLSPPIGKSGVNHRLRKLGEIAQKHREEKL